ncbi:3-deoxy-D-manno-octulosonate 8-phosphate phosphatase [bacterium]|nr:3-deoxy-D-manno-octulosonate 8-phosphate phosphatase [bacterium]
MIKWHDIKIIFSDIDGVLTNGSLMIFNNGIYGKTFSTRDGQGIVMAVKQGIKIYWITGRDDYASRIRAEELSVGYIYSNGRSKLVIVEEILKKEKLKRSNAVFIGDDIPDLIVREKLFFACPQDAHESARAHSDLIIPLNGGQGVLRYIIDKVVNEN